MTLQKQGGPLLGQLVGFRLTIAISISLFRCASDAPLIRSFRPLDHGAISILLRADVFVVPTLSFFRRFFKFASLMIPKCLGPALKKGIFGRPGQGPSGLFSPRSWRHRVTDGDYIHFPPERRWGMALASWPADSLTPRE